MSENPNVYLCRGDRKNTYLAFFIFLGIAVLGFATVMLDIASPVVGQAIIFLSLIVAAYIFIRYIATFYRYEILSEEDGDHLLIVSVQGKKDFTRQKLALADLSAVIEIENNPNVPKEHPKLPVINVSSHLLADSYTLLHFEGDEPLLLRINADEAFLSLLSSYLPPKESVVDDGVCEND